MRNFRTSLAVAALMATCASLFAAAPDPRHKKKPHKPDLAQQISDLLASPKVSRAHWGISVTTMEGKSLYALNDGQYFQPASNTKLITTATALALLGPNFTAKTLLTESGNRTADGVLHGNLRLVGTGDPSLNNLTWPYVAPTGASERFDTLPEAFNELARAAAQSGLKSVDGAIIADDSYFPHEPYGHGWSWDDLVYYYAVPISAINVNDNVDYVTLTPGASVGDPVQAEWALPMPQYELDIKGLMTSAAGTPMQIQVDHMAETRPLRIYGGLPVGRVLHLPIAVDDPAAFAGELLRSALMANGISVTGATQVVHQEDDEKRDFSKVVAMPLSLHSNAEAMMAMEPKIAASEHILATHVGVPLWQDIQFTDKVSQNQHAEILMHLVARGYGSNGSAAQGIRVERQFLIGAGIDPDDFQFYDGSGMSNNDMITPRALTALLRYAKTQSWGQQLHDALGVGGVDGTLKARFAKAPLKGNVVAKTGTLSEARALSGYLTCASGKTIVFSILADMHTPTTSADRQTMDEIVGLIAAAN